MCHKTCKNMFPEKKLSFFDEIITRNVKHELYYNIGLYGFVARNRRMSLFLPYHA